MRALHRPTAALVIGALLLALGSACGSPETDAQRTRISEVAADSAAEEAWCSEARRRPPVMRAQCPCGCDRHTHTHTLAHNIGLRFGARPAHWQPPRFVSFALEAIEAEAGSDAPRAKIEHVPLAAVA